MSNQTNFEELYFKGLEIDIEINYHTIEQIANEPIINHLGLFPNQRYVLKDPYDVNSPLPVKISADNFIHKHALKSKYYEIQASDIYQKIALDLLHDETIPMVVIFGKAGVGKAQPLNSLILTPNGYIEMKDVKIGDEVSTPCGGKAKIIGIFPQGKIPIYKVYFTDNTTTECSLNHLWKTLTSTERDSKKPGKVRSLSEIQSSLRYAKSNKKNHSIPITKPIEMNKKNILLNPYLLGLLLGDGCFRAETPSITNSDEEIINKINEILKQDFITYRLSKVHSPYTYNLISGVREKNKIKEILIKLNLWKLKSYEKFIPKDFLYSSIEDRLEILQGLMDTDGTIEKEGHIEFDTTSPYLMEDVKFLVQSLGGTASVKERITKYTYKGVKKEGRLSYRIGICLPNEIIPFKLSRKINKIKTRIKYFPRRYIDKIEYIEEKEAQCIMIDHPDHLYMTNDCIVTHNTHVALGTALQMLKENKVPIVYFIKPLISVSRSKFLGAMPGSLGEKVAPFLESFYDVAYSLDQTLTLERLITAERIEFVPIDFIRGRSLNNALIIVDEAQNMDHHDLLAVLTRVGKNSRIVLLGDPNPQQHDLGKEVGLKTLISSPKFWNSNHTACVHLSKRMRNPIVELAEEILA